MKFNEATDSWFDKLSESSDLAIVPIFDAAEAYPTARNLRRLRSKVCLLEDVNVRSPLLFHIDAICSFKGEFRFIYHRYPRNQRFDMCSACGELFSMVRQAIEYKSYVQVLDKSRV